MKPADKNNGLTPEYVRSIFDYDSAAGLLKWRKLPHVSASNIKVGGVAGFLENTGYTRVRIGGHQYMAHRLIWLYVHGEWPREQVDHKDRDKGNNRIDNLRLADNRLNRANTAVNANNFLGCKGVQLHKQSGKYRARICVYGKHISLGLHHKIEDAVAAYTKAAKDHFGDYARTE